MNIYLLKQKQNNGYDTYDSCVVIANNADEARKIHPGGSHGEKDPDDVDEDDGSWTGYWKGSWCASPDDVTVIHIGTALPDSKSGVVLSSFNAG